MKPMLLGLDLGTTNVKAVLTAMDGRIARQYSVPVALHYTGDAGVEQDIEEIWRAVIEAIQRVLPCERGCKVRAIGISSQGGALQIIDPAGKPVGRVVSWLDGRGRLDDAKFTRRQGAAWFRNQIHHECSGLALGQLRRIGREQPSRIRPPNRIGFVGDVIALRLCGQFAHDGTSAGLTLLYNPQTRKYAPELLEALGIRESQLPAITFGAAGSLLPQVAAETGLEAGIPVSAPIHDQYAAALGTGVVHEGDVMLGAGTAWVLLAVAARLPQPAMEAALLCDHVVEGLYGEILSMPAGGSSFTWALKITGYGDLKAAEVEKHMAAVKPGCAGLSFWPFLVASDPPGLEPGTRGRLAGLQLAHERAHVLRAVVEGLAFELNRHLNLLRSGGVDARRLVMCGGATGSNVTTKIIADVTGIPVACSPGEGGSLHGAVILARSLVEPASSLKALSLAMLPSMTPVRPGANAPIYRRLYDNYLNALPARKSDGSIGFGRQAGVGEFGVPALAGKSLDKTEGSASFNVSPAKAGTPNAAPARVPRLLNRKKNQSSVGVKKKTHGL
jgi:xylulokinase